MSNNRSTQHSNSVIPSEGERLMQIVYVLLAIAIMLLVATYTPPTQVDATASLGVADIVVATNAERMHWGDCGIDLYPRPESGASGYCYVYEQEKAVVIIQVTDRDIDDNDDAVITTPDKPSTTPDNTPKPEPKPEPKKEKKQHCDKGEGNGGEGCDPGNNPDKGNDDEDGNKKKDKKEK